MLTRRQTLQGLCAAGLAAASSAVRAESRDATLNVLSFNIWNGGRHGGLEQTAKVIGASQADVVGIQEIAESGPKLAELTGLNLFVQDGDARGALLSRFPIVKASANKWGVKLDVQGRGPLWLFNAHLPASPYQPYQLADIPYGKGDPFIKTAAEAIAEAIRARSGQLARLLMDMGPALRAGEPILLTGDFNEPSHLDWTERAVQAGQCQMPIAWPSSRTIVDSGFTDVYRTVHHDEVTRPGHTWTPVPSEREAHDRIDIVYSRGLKLVAAKVIGESSERADLVVTPYPSDHRAVAATVAFT
ncbi:MAG: endonuclease/exonuclease/phosphatase family protein [Pirellulales bacterium]|nr:endonuclease/exonuclease/phosphatase family protein [Pirellulales bacterium]